MDPTKIIIEPIVTEKSNQMRDGGKYVFKVDSRANKLEIMRAIRELFNVHPVACHIMRVKRKPKRVRYQLGYTSEWKKAIVTLRAGEVIQIFEGV
ncbi:MAG: 50S ribosomal protein L23 [Spirochaetales bacterium]|nr:50S ribosomal protein L23 [Spirochaetales bacterium]